MAKIEFVIIDFAHKGDIVKKEQWGGTDVSVISEILEKIDEEPQFYKLCASGEKLESTKIRKVEEQVDELVQYYKKIVS